MSGKFSFKILIFFLFTPIFAADFKPKIGDLIFRKGLDRDSEFISFLSKFDYSHIGVIVSLNPTNVIHATTNENNQSGVIKSEFESFIKNAKFYAVKRFENLSQESANKISEILHSHLGKAFVIASKNEPNLYCTTLLKSAFDEIYPLDLDYEILNIPFFRGEYLFPKAFWNLPDLSLIFESR